MLSENDFQNIFLPSDTMDFIEAKEHMKSKGLSDKHLWTIIDGDSDGAMYASPGIHVVNKVGFVVTKEPWTVYEDAFWIEPQVGLLSLSDGKFGLWEMGPNGVSIKADDMMVVFTIDRAGDVPHLVLNMFDFNEQLVANEERLPLDMNIPGFSVTDDYNGETIWEYDDEDPEQILSILEDDNPVSRYAFHTGIEDSTTLNIIINDQIVELKRDKNSFTVNNQVYELNSDGNAPR
jgi:hypothetical protein